MGTALVWLATVAFVTAIVGLVRGRMTALKLFSRGPFALLLLASVIFGSVGASLQKASKDSGHLSISSIQPSDGSTAAPDAVPTVSEVPSHSATIKSSPKASRPVPKPSPKAVQAPLPQADHATAPPVEPPATRNLCGAPSNPFGYNFCSGAFIYSPDPTTCNYFDCIANFWNGKGYMEECQDATYSMSGGRQGACSHHGGELRPVYS